MATSLRASKGLLWLKNLCAVKLSGVALHHVGYRTLPALHERCGETNGTERFDRILALISDEIDWCGINSCETIAFSLF